MASFTLERAQVFPDGTTVKAYAVSNWPDGNPSGAPRGASAAEGTVSGGVVTFSGLTQGVGYTATAEVSGVRRYIGFLIPAAASGSTSTGRIYEPKAIGDFQELIAAESSRASVVADPLGQKGQVFKLETRNGDVSPLTPTENPRCQLHTPGLLTVNEGAEADLYFRFGFMLPAGTPAIVGGKFFQLMEIFGQPFEGSPPFSMGATKEGTEEFLFWQRNATYEADIPWEDSEVLKRGYWYDFTVRYFAASSARGGRLEMWKAGTQQTFFKPGFSYNPKGHAETQLLLMSTVDASNNKGGNSLYIGNYRAKNTTGMEATPIITYYTPPRFGLTRESVEG